MYRLFHPDGSPIEDMQPIIDAIPTSNGYTPWWRIHRVVVTDAYRGERIWSRAGIDVALDLGLVEQPEPTPMIMDCPVAHQNTRIEVSVDAEPIAPTPVWYRKQRVHWFCFRSSMLRLNMEDGDGEPIREMPQPPPLYVFQRTNEALPLTEWEKGVDFNEDDRLDASNNLFAARIGEARFSPLWQVKEVLTTPDYRWIDNTPDFDADVTAESQFVETASIVGITQLPDQLVNCPLQLVDGQL